MQIRLTLEICAGMPLGVNFVLRAMPKRAQRALWAGKQILYGNRISEDGGNK
jgi:hypothetical protein